MIHPDDVAAWIAQVRQNPEAAPKIIEALAARLVELDQKNEALRDELVRLSRVSETSGEEKRVVALERRLQTLERQVAHSEGTARFTLVFTLDGRGARLPLPGVDEWRGRSDPGLVASHLRPRHLVITDEDDDLLLFTDKGRVVRLPVTAVSAAEAPASYLSLVPDFTLDLNESLSVVISLPLVFDQLTLITRKGFARSFRRAEVDSLLERGLPLHSSPVAGDFPAFALLSDGKGELLVATRMGKGVRFPERQVGVQAKPAINLERGDVVTGAAVVDDKTNLAMVSADGVAVRREMEGFGAHSLTGNRGKILTRIGDVMAIAPVEPNNVFWLLTAGGKLMVTSVTQVPSSVGASSGKLIVGLGEDRLVALAVGEGA